MWFPLRSLRTFASLRERVHFIFERLEGAGFTRRRKDSQRPQRDLFENVSQLHRFWVFLVSDKGAYNSDGGEGMRFQRLTSIIAAGAWVVMLLLACDSSDVSAHDGHKHSHAPASARKLKNPIKATPENIERARALYVANCASCHGEDGKSKTDIASVMTPKPTDLTAKEMKGITDGEIYWVITNGIKKSGMPALKTKRTDEERWLMTEYVKKLAAG